MRCGGRVCWANAELCWLFAQGCARESRVRSMLGRRALAEGCARACGARAAVRREVRAVAGKRGLPRGRAPGVMCMGLRNFLAVHRISYQ